MVFICDSTIKLRQDEYLLSFENMCNFLTFNHVNGKGSYKGFEEVHENVYPTCSTAARMYELPKLHKEFDAVPAFRPISSLTGTYSYL